MSTPGSKPGRAGGRLRSAAPAAVPGIAAAAAGKVVLVKNSPSYGKYIKVDHGKGLVTLYAHCNSIIKKEGDMVRKGETIATVGNTGQSTGYHLHFEVILNGKNLNPEWLLKW